MVLKHFTLQLLYLLKGIQLRARLVVLSYYFIRRAKGLGLAGQAEEPGFKKIRSGSLCLQLAKTGVPKNRIVEPAGDRVDGLQVTQGRRQALMAREVGVGFDEDAPEGRAQNIKAF